jgi:hypothetical protein
LGLNPAVFEPGGTSPSSDATKLAIKPASSTTGDADPLLQLRRRLEDRESANQLVMSGNGWSCCVFNISTFTCAITNTGKLRNVYDSSPSLPVE